MKKYPAVLAILALWAVASGCAYLGSAKDIDPAEFDKDAGWLAVRDLQFERQKTDNDCGAASVSMVLNHWGLPATVDDVVAGCPTSKDGMRAGDLRDLIKKRGLEGYLIHGTFDDLKTELAAKRPVIVGLIKPYVQGGLNHYEVVMAIHPEQRLVATLDPAKGPRQNTFEGFLQEWEPAGSLTIVVTGRNGKAHSKLPFSVFPPETAWLEARSWKLEAANSTGSSGPSACFPPETAWLEARSWKLEAANSTGSCGLTVCFPPKTVWLGAGGWKLEAANSISFRTGSDWYAGKPLTPLMAAPHPGGAIPFPSGCRRPSFCRNAGESGVLYRDEGRTGNQEVCVVGHDE